MASSSAMRATETPEALVAENYRDAFRSLFEQSGMCMANLDPGMRVLEVNTYFFKQFGRGAADVRGRSFYDFLHPSVRGKFQHRFNRLVEGRNRRFVEHAVAVGAKDALFGGELTGIAVPDRSGRAEGVMVLLQPDEAQRSAMVTGKEKLLSEIDARILEGVAAGESTVQLAAKLYLSRGGVEYHVTTLLRKLKVTNRPALVSKGYSMGILDVGQWPPRVLPEYVK